MKTDGVFTQEINKNNFKGYGVGYFYTGAFSFDSRGYGGHAFSIFTLPKGYVGITDYEHSSVPKKKNGEPITLRELLLKGVAPEQIGTGMYYVFRDGIAVGEKLDVKDKTPEIIEMERRATDPHSKQVTPSSTVQVSGQTRLPGNGMTR